MSARPSALGKGQDARLAVAAAASVAPAPLAARAAAAPEEGAVPRRPAFLTDLLALTKPRITSLVVATMLAGVALARRLAAPGEAGPPRTTVALALLGTVLVVSGANALNMVLERDTDGLMTRTRDRPLPARRMSPEVALWFGLALAAAALPLLFVAVNPLTGALASFALASYVLAYTPLKRRTTWALQVGAVPGAIPPLLGWTTVTGRLGVPGVLLFAVLVIWQIPHFLAIATFRRDDYARAGLQVLPVVRGDRPTRVQVVLYLVVLVALSGAFFPIGAAGPVYLGAAAALGAGFLGCGVWGLRRTAGVRWARALFAVSIVYLVLLLAALVSGA